MIASSSSVRYKPATFPSQSHTDDALAVGVSIDAAGVRLSADPDGPLSLNVPDGSLGRLTLPRGVAITPSGRCFFVDRRTSRLYSFDPLGAVDPTAPFRHLVTFDYRAAENAPDPMSARWSLAATEDSLFVIRPQHAALFVVSLRTWSTQEIQRFTGRRGTKPIVDVVTFEHRVIALAERCVYQKSGPAADWLQIGKLPFAVSRLLVDRFGQIHVFAPRLGVLPLQEALGLQAMPTTFRFPDRTQFPLPQVVSLAAQGHTQDGIYLVSPALAAPCVQQQCMPSSAPAELPPEFPPELQFPPVTRAMFDTTHWEHGFLIREDGKRVSLEAYHGVQQHRLFRTGGLNQERCECVSARIDSGLYQCRWDRLVLETAPLPAGGTVSLLTYTSDDEQANPNLTDTPASQWAHADTFSANQSPTEIPVRSGPGQYLWIRLQLSGDGFSTPVVRQIMVRGPRQSPVDFLPAVFRGDEQSRDFLERFLGVFQDELDAVGDIVDHSHQHFDPHYADVRMLPQLAEWLGIELPTSWDADRQRRMLEAVPLLSGPTSPSATVPAAEIRGTMRGTIAHVQRYAQAVLTGMTGLSTAEMRGFPWIIEGFRERNTFWLRDVDSTTEYAPVARLDDPASQSLASPDSVGRIRLGETSVLGQHKLLPARDEWADLFQLYAHRIRIVVPASWVQSEADHSALAAAIAAEKPAHIQMNLTLVRPGIQIGLQSTVGIDTILADAPTRVLRSGARCTFTLGPEITLPTDQQRPPPLAVDGELRPQHEL